MNLSDKLTDLSLSEGPKAMFERIVKNSDVYYRSEQRGAPDLTEKEKLDLLSRLYDENPRLFMRRYSQYMVSADCKCFDLSDYEMAYHAKLVDSRCSSADKPEKRNKKEVLVRNQRYAELERLKRETDYFSNAKMREREPLLFDKMVGKFLSEEEQLYLRPTVENDSLSGMFMQFEDSKIISDRRKKQQRDHKYAFQRRIGISEDFSEFGNLARHIGSRVFVEEQEDDDEAGCSSDAGGAKMSGATKSECSKMDEERSIEEVVQPEDCSSSEDERTAEQLKSDFIDHMEQRFLKGEDEEFFDYSTIEGGPFSREFEKMRNQDIEDAYFDSD